MCYSGLGGHTGVVFPLISADSTSNEWAIGFVGNAKLLPNFVDQCNFLKIQYKDFLFHSGFPFFAWINLFFWFCKIRPEGIICHNSSFLFPCKIYSLLFSANIIVVEHTNNQLKRKKDWLFSFFSIVFANKVVLLTESYRSELEKVFKRFNFKKKYHVVPNGVDIQKFPLINFNSNHRHERENFILGMAARFTDIKRQDLLLKAIQRINNSHSSEINLKLSLAGNGPELNRIKSLAKKLEITPMISFEGLIEEWELPDWYKNLDLYIHATEGETLSISILQAMSVGLPILASDVHGVSNLLYQDEKFGHCVPNNEIAFAKEILCIHSNYQESVNMGLKARAKVEQDLLLSTEGQRKQQARIGGGTAFISDDFIDKFKNTGSGVTYGDYLQDKDSMDTVASTSDGDNTLTLSSLSDAYKTYTDEEDDANTDDFLKNYLSGLS